MKRLIVICMALLLALAPAATAEAAKGGKSKAAKTCVAKKAAKGKNAKKANKAKKCAKKAKKAKKAPKVAPATAAAERDCRADRRLDPDGFTADYGTGNAAVAKCAAELLQSSEEEPLDDELLENEPAEDDQAEAPFEGPDAPDAEDDDLV